MGCSYGLLGRPSANPYCLGAPDAVAVDCLDAATLFGSGVSTAHLDNRGGTTAVELLSMNQLTKYNGDFFFFQKANDQVLEALLVVSPWRAPVGVRRRAGNMGTSI